MDGYGGFVMKDDEFDFIDDRLGKGLVRHLKSHFRPRFSAVKRWRDLVSLNLNSDALDRLYLAEKFKMFKGKCDICKDWPTLPWV